MSPTTKKKLMTLVPNKIYRVIKPGAHLSWWKPSGPFSYSGQSHHLVVGDELKYCGSKHGIGSDDVDYDVFKFNDVVGDFWPNSWGKCDVEFLEEVED